MQFDNVSTPNDFTMYKPQLSIHYNCNKQNEINKYLQEGMAPKLRDDYCLVCFAAQNLNKHHSSLYIEYKLGSIVLCNIIPNKV